MEFHVDGLPAKADMTAITDAVCNIDPAAVVDLDPATGALRVNASMSAGELTTALDGSGQASDGMLVMQLPSNCCGGCGG